MNEDENISTETQEEQPQNADQSKSSKNFLPFVVFIVSLAAIFILFLAISYFIGSNKKSSEVLPTETPTQSEIPTLTVLSDSTEISPTETISVTQTVTITPTLSPAVSSAVTSSPTQSPTPTVNPKPDLYINLYEFTPSTPVQGEEFEIKIQIYNKGNKAAGAFWWEFWPTKYNYACRERIESLAARGGRVVTCKYTYGGWADYQTKGVADADNEVSESDESNNVYIKNITPIH